MDSLSGPPAPFKLSTPNRDVSKSGEEALAAPIDGTKVPFELYKISELRTGKVSANPVIRPGDYVLVTEAEPVYITGSVIAPQGIFLRDQLTLSRALAMVGGARKEAKLSDVRIYRQKPCSRTRDDSCLLSAIRKNISPTFLQAFDIIDFPEAGMFSGSGSHIAHGRCHEFSNMSLRAHGDCEQVIY